MSGAAAKLLDLLFPPKCVFCGKILPAGAKHLCPRCQKELPWLEGPAAEQKGEFFSLCVSPLRYQDKVRDSVRRYKFHGRRAYCKGYGSLVAQCVREHLAGRYDLISWVPLSRRRQRERGYDQAFLLASAAALELGGVAVETLRKERDTEPQSRLSGPAERRANVLGAYAPVDQTLVEGRRVLLIDDVVTTGATLSECARTLRSVGAAEVVCVTLARAGQEKPPKIRGN